MKTLGIDYGTKRIGLAVTDPLCTIATPLVGLKNKGDAKNVATIANIMKNERVERVVVGLPKLPCGADSWMTQVVRDFGTMLGEKTGIWIIYFDEGYTSRMAEEHIRGTLGIREPKKVRELLDKMAAAMILMEYVKTEK